MDRVLEAVAELDTTVRYASPFRPFDGETLRGALGAPEIVLAGAYLAGISSAAISGALPEPRRPADPGRPSVPKLRTRRR